ncbi:hypothetical protein [Streptomyces sp. cmx-4-9]|uniref:hypothetical protein n=1 Tax=Streptomyces sp. cmx-4-9 TaxID=2790941 RepID=UPI00397F2978
MKFTRMAVVAAAAVVGPGVLMATPAMADEAKGPAVTAPDAGPQSGAPAAEQPYSGPVLALDGLPKDGFEAGGEWTELTLRMDNSAGKALTSYDIALHIAGSGAPVKASMIEVEHRYAGVWQAAERVGPSPDSAVFDLLAGIPVAQDKSIQIPVRVRVAADAPAAPLDIVLTGSNHLEVDSKDVRYTSKTTRRQQAPADAPRIRLGGLPPAGFTAGDPNGRVLTLGVDNSGRPGTGEFRVGVDLVTEGAEIRPDQVQVEFLATTVHGESYWHPVEVRMEDGKLRIFDHGGEYGAGEKRDLVFQVRFAQGTPATSFSLRLSGTGSAQHGGAAADPVAYSSHIGSPSESADVEGPRMAVDGFPSGGFRAGGDWHELQLQLDNTGKADLADFLVAAHMGRGAGEGPWVTASQVRLQAQGAAGWYDIAIDGSEETLGGDIGAVPLRAGEQTTLKLRVRFTGDTVPGDFHVLFDGYAHAPSGQFVSSGTVSVPTRILAPATGTGTGIGTGTGTGDGSGGARAGGGADQPQPHGAARPAAGPGGGVAAATVGGRLATAGADPAAAWALGGAGLAVAMGAAFVAGTGKRRRPAR